MSNFQAVVQFCDDIRLEKSGKWLIVGLYPTDLVARGGDSAVLVRAVVSLFGPFSPDKHYAVNLKISQMGPATSEANSIEGEVTVVVPAHAAGKAILMTPPFPVIVHPEETLLIARVSINGQDCPVIGSLPVRQSEVDTAVS